MIKSLKVRLYPNKSQQNLINKTFGCKRLEKSLAKDQWKLSRQQKLALDSNKKLSDCKNYQKQKK